MKLLNFLIRSKRKSYALNRLDIKLNKYINYRNGFFIEVGANDGIKQSNTLFFERYLGWKGLLVEAIPVLAEKCKNNRPNCIIENCALVSNDYPEETIDIHYCGLMSIINNNEINNKEHINAGRKFLKNGETDYIINIQTNTLKNLIIKHHIQKIDLLSLDVEGFELNVLKGLDFSIVMPKFMLIEVRNREEMDSYLKNHYYVHSILNEGVNYSDILYKRKNNRN